MKNPAKSKGSSSDKGGKVKKAFSLKKTKGAKRYESVVHENASQLLEKMLEDKSSGPDLSDEPHDLDADDAGGDPVYGRKMAAYKKQRNRRHPGVAR